MVDDAARLDEIERLYVNRGIGLIPVQNGLAHPHVIGLGLEEYNHAITDPIAIARRHMARVRSLEGDVEGWIDACNELASGESRAGKQRDQAQQAHRLAMSANAKLTAELKEARASERTAETNLNNLAQHADLLHDQRDKARDRYTQTLDGWRRALEQRDALRTALDRIGMATGAAEDAIANNPSGISRAAIYLVSVVRAERKALSAPAGAGGATESTSEPVEPGQAAAAPVKPDREPHPFLGGKRARFCFTCGVFRLDHEGSEPAPACPGPEIRIGGPFGFKAGHCPACPSRKEASD